MELCCSTQKRLPVLEQEIPGLPVLTKEADFPLGGLEKNMELLAEKGLSILEGRNQPVPVPIGSKSKGLVEEETKEEGGERRLASAAAAAAFANKKSLNSDIEFALMNFMELLKQRQQDGRMQQAVAQERELRERNEALLRDEIERLKAEHALELTRLRKENTDLREENESSLAKLRQRNKVLEAHLESAMLMDSNNAKSNKEACHPNIKPKKKTSRRKSDQKLRQRMK